MKILIAISDSFCGNFIRGQAQFLRSKGHEVVIVSPQGKEVDEIREKERCKLVEVPFSREISILDDISSIFNIVRVIKTEKPLIINAGNPKTGFLFTLVGVFFPKIPVIFTLRGLRSDTLKGVKGKIVAFTEYLSCKFADKVIVISPSLKDHAIKRGLLDGRKAIVIGQGSSNGVDIEKFKLTSSAIERGQKLRKEIGIKESDFLIGFVGRITKDKGVEELYSAFKIAGKDNPELKLLLVGPIENGDPINGELLSEMQKDSRVFMMGKRYDVTEVYAAINILVLYSHREGFGNVVLEASSMKLPVLVADIPGLRDTVEKNKTGLLIPPKNPVELAKGILYCFKNKNFMVECGELGRKRVESSFSSEVIWEGQLDLYKKLSSNV